MHDVGFSWTSIARNATTVSERDLWGARTVRGVTDSSVETFWRCAFQVGLFHSIIMKILTAHETFNTVSFDNYCKIIRTPLVTYYSSPRRIIPSPSVPRSTNVARHHHPFPNSRATVSIYHSALRHHNSLSSARLYKYSTVLSTW